MEFKFKRFEDTHARVEDRITVTKSGAIGFPTKFYNDNQIKGYKYIVLYYDQEQLGLGVLFTNNENEKGRFTIIHSKQKYGGSVIVRSFFKLSGVDPIKYHGRYKWERKQYPGIGELYVIKLEERDKKEM